MNCKKCLLNTLQRYIHNTTTDWNYITPIQFYLQYFKPNLNNYFLIDLRRPEDFNKFHIKNATNIFWLDLLDEKNLHILPKDKHIFLICYVGHTSSQAMVILRLLGYKVTSIKYGYGLSPDSKIPVAGWLNYNLPIVKYI